MDTATVFTPPSYKTRIETVLKRTGFQSALEFLPPLPIKQGLKPEIKEINETEKTRFLPPLPIKQGLKRYSNAMYNIILIVFTPPSYKTRIETSDWWEI